MNFPVICMGIAVMLIGCTAPVFGMLFIRPLTFISSAWMIWRR